MRVGRVSEGERETDRLRERERQRERECVCVGVCVSRHHMTHDKHRTRPVSFAKEPYKRQYSAKETYNLIDPTY